MGKLNTKGDRLSRSQRSSSRSRCLGVSLLEVVIALAVLGFGMLGAAAAQIAAFQGSDQARERVLAQSLAQQQIEAFSAMSATALEAIRTSADYPNDPTNPIDPDPNDSTAMRFNRTWTITPDTPEDDIYTIRVNVGWTGARGAQSVQLETFRTRL